MLIKEICESIEEFAPLSYQESYDNAGLLLGSPDDKVEKALICIDITMEVVEEAIQKHCGIIISHHPLIFTSIKSLTGKSDKERMIIRLIKENIAVYAVHTNIDSSAQGVSYHLAKKIGLGKVEVLHQKTDVLEKLVCFCPQSHAEELRLALFKAGAGNIGNYDSCSFNLEGQGSFRAKEGATPFVGEIDKLHYEKEIRIETIFESANRAKIIKAILANHPYEEVAYDIYALKNNYAKQGLGAIGELKKAKSAEEFLEMLKKIFALDTIRFSKWNNNPVKKIAVCGGSGASLIPNAIKAKADVYVSADFKYHDFELASKRLLLVDIGHFESEEHTKDIISSLLIKKNPTFAVENSEIKTNFVHYL